MWELIKFFDNLKLLCEIDLVLKRCSGTTKNNQKGISWIDLQTYLNGIKT